MGLRSWLQGKARELENVVKMARTNAYVSAAQTRQKREERSLTASAQQCYDAMSFQPLIDLEQFIQEANGALEGSVGSTVASESMYGFAREYADAAPSLPPWRAVFIGGYIATSYHDTLLNFRSPEVVVKLEHPIARISLRPHSALSRPVAFDVTAHERAVYATTRGPEDVPALCIRKPNAYADASGWEELLFIGNAPAKEREAEIGKMFLKLAQSPPAKL